MPSAQLETIGGTKASNCLGYLPKKVLRGNVFFWGQVFLEYFLYAFFCEPIFLLCNFFLNFEKREINNKSHFALPSFPLIIFWGLLSFFPLLPLSAN